MKGSLVLGGLLLFSWPLALPEEESKTKESKLDLTQPYVVLAAANTSILQKQLNEAAAAGYRLRPPTMVPGGLREVGAQIALTMKKLAHPTGIYEYRVLATNKTAKMQKEVAATAAQGFRVVRGTLMVKERIFRGHELVVVMEKAPGAPAQYEYLLLGTMRSSTLDREKAEASKQGYELVGWVNRVGGKIVILEKPAAK